MTDRVLVISAASCVSDAALDAISDSAPWIRLGPNAAECAWEADRPLPVLTDMDANLVATENRKKRLLIADMDSTMIPVECIDEIADEAGIKDQVAGITERAMRGEIDFAEALRARVALLRGLAEGALERTYQTRISLNPGARALVSVMNAEGAMTALVSGGFTYFTERVAAAAGFAMNSANTLIIENGVLTGAVADPILGRAAKLDALNAICAERGIGVEDAVAVGDGANDLDMIKAAGLGVAYRAKPVVAAQAGARLDHSDLTAILALQGLTAPQGEWDDQP